MAGAHSKIGNAAWDLVPGPLRSKLQSEAGKRFMRFVPVSLAALASSQITLAVLVGVAQVAAGRRRVRGLHRGRGRQLRAEPLGVGAQGPPGPAPRDAAVLDRVDRRVELPVVHQPRGEHLVPAHGPHRLLEHVAVVNGAYFLANCFTFVARFVIFHYVLFASHGNKARAAQVLSPSQQLAEAEEQAAQQGGVGHRADDEPAPAPAEYGGQPRARR